ncbi:MAG: hypothetical protein AB4040_09895 [Synechococcus sp.]
MATFRINGSVINRETGNGVPGLRIEIWDKDNPWDNSWDIIQKFHDDRVWTAITAEQGLFKIQFNEIHFQELFENRFPDLYFKVFAYHQQLQSTIQGTEVSVLQNLGAGDTEVTIEVDIPKTVRTRMAKFHWPRQNNQFGEHFLCGHIIYHSKMKQQFEDDSNYINIQEYLEAWIGLRIKQGFNLFHIRTGQRNLSNLLYYRSLIKKYHFNIKLIAQFEKRLNNYSCIGNNGPSPIDLTDESIEEKECIEKLAAIDSIFILHHGEDPNVLAFAAHEEPKDLNTMRLVNMLHSEINKILDTAGPADFQLTYSQPDTYGWPEGEEYLEINKPLIMSPDVYPFGREQEKSPLKQPISALDDLSNSYKTFGIEARKHNAHFQAIITASAKIHVFDVVNNLEDLENRVQDNLRYGLDGWKSNEITNYENGTRQYVICFFKHYHPPMNCTRCMVWLAVMNGARSILNWNDSYPDILDRKVFCDENYNFDDYIYSSDDPEITYEDQTDHLKEKKIKWQMHMTGMPPRNATNTNNVTFPSEDDLMMLREYSETCRYLQDYGWLINRMEYIASMDDIVNAEDNEIDQIRINLGERELTFHVVTPNVDYSVFHLPGYTGLILVVVNKDVGFLSGTNLRLSPKGFVEEASSREEAQSNPGTYYPYPSNDSDSNVNISIARSVGQIPTLVGTIPIKPYNYFDFDRPHDALFRGDDSDSLAILPGDGKFLFYGPLSEFRIIRSKMGFFD